MKVLLLATDSVTPYRVLRCAHACGTEVYVLGNAAVKMLRMSRFCKRAFVSGCIINGDRQEVLALEVNTLVGELGIDMIIPTDAPAIRSLLLVRDTIETRCFPLPTLEAFDLLNNKWSFAQLCTELSIRHPTTRMLPDVSVLREELASGAVMFPVIVKPIDRCGSVGVSVLESGDAISKLSAINYRPVLVQEFVGGEDIGASAFARSGRIEAFVVHSLHAGVYTTFCDNAIYGEIEKIVARLGLHGIYNFDMIRSEDGVVHYLECNPRPFYKIDLSMIAGINFIEIGMFPDHQPLRTSARSFDSVVHFPKALLRSIVASGRCSRRDWALAAHLLSDPIPFILEKLGVTA